MSSSNFSKNRAFHRRLAYAWSGISAAFRREFSFRLQIVALITLVVFCGTLKPSPLWCALFALSSALVLCLELVNTALESLLDRLHPGHDPEIGFIKDCMAGAVLIASFAALFVMGCFLLMTFVL